MSKVIDETGKIYGRLKVLRRNGSNSQGRALWECQCECGNIITVNGVELRNGHTKSCGCYQKDRTRETCIKNLVGKTIGNFTVLESINGVKTRGPSHSWRCRCNLCGREDFIITTHNIYHQYSCGCSISSKGERKIAELLDNQNIHYIKEKRFNNCIFPDNNYLARFDFYLPDYNTLLEYDGIQHFSIGKGYFDNPDKFKLTQEHDNFKNNWAKENGYTIIRIPYTQYDNLTIEDLLPDTSTFIVK